MDKARNIGWNIMKFRKQKNMTQEQLGKLTGWSRGQISRYEHGKIKRINYEFLLVIAEALQVTIEELEEN